MLSKLQNPALPNLDYKPLNEMLDLEIETIEPRENTQKSLVDF